MFKMLCHYVLCIIPYFFFYISYTLILYYYNKKLFFPLSYFSFFLITFLLICFFFFSYEVHVLTKYLLFSFCLNIFSFYYFTNKKKKKNKVNNTSFGTHPKYIQYLLALLHKMQQKKKK